MEGFCECSTARCQLKTDEEVQKEIEANKPIPEYCRCDRTGEICREIVFKTTNALNLYR